MKMLNKGLLAGLLTALFALAPAAPSAALDFTNIAYVQTSAGTTSIPVGHLEFCQSNPAECRGYDRVYLRPYWMIATGSSSCPSTPITTATLYRSQIRTSIRSQSSGLIRTATATVKTLHSPNVAT